MPFFFCCGKDKDKSEDRQNDAVELNASAVGQLVSAAANVMVPIASGSNELQVRFTRDEPVILASDKEAQTDEEQPASETQDEGTLKPAKPKCLCMISTLGTLLQPEKYEVPALTEKFLSPVEEEAMKLYQKPIPVPIKKFMSSIEEDAMRLYEKPLPKMAGNWEAQTPSCRPKDDHVAIVRMAFMKPIHPSGAAYGGAGAAEEPGQDIIREIRADDYLTIPKGIRTKIPLKIVSEAQGNRQQQDSSVQRDAPGQQQNQKISEQRQQQDTSGQQQNQNISEKRWIRQSTRSRKRYPSIASAPQSIAAIEAATAACSKEKASYAEACAASTSTASHQQDANQHRSLI